MSLCHVSEITGNILSIATKAFVIEWPYLGIRFAAHVSFDSDLLDWALRTQPCISVFWPSVLLCDKKKAISFEPSVLLCDKKKAISFEVAFVLSDATLIIFPRLCHKVGFSQTGSISIALVSVLRASESNDWRLPYWIFRYLCDDFAL